VVAEEVRHLEAKEGVMEEAEAAPIIVRGKRRIRMRTKSKRRVKLEMKNPKMLKKEHLSRFNDRNPMALKWPLPNKKKTHSHKRVAVEPTAVTIAQSVLSPKEILLVRLQFLNRINQRELNNRILKQASTRLIRRDSDATLEKVLPEEAVDRGARIKALVALVNLKKERTKGSVSSVEGEAEVVMTNTVAKTANTTNNKVRRMLMMISKNKR